MGIVALLSFLGHFFQLLSLPLAFIAPKTFRSINAQLAGGLWRSWVWLVEDWHHTTITLMGDKPKEHENAIILCNHQSWSDIVIVSRFALEAKMIAHQKWMAKNILRFVPFMGWGLHFIDTVFLKRDWHKDRVTIEQTFSNIVNKRIPFFLVIFPEGTRRTPHKLSKSQSFMSSKGEPFWRHLLRPRSKGFASAMVGLAPQLDAIYSLTIHYGKGAAPTPFELFNGQSSSVTIDVKRYSKEDIVKILQDESFSDFLMQDSARKELILEKALSAS